jgi:putative phosphoribosyl transferase
MTDTPLDIDLGVRRVKGVLTIPPACRGIVVFAHGSGSGQLSPRNQYVARRMQEAGLGTALVDLLEETETRIRARVFDIELLSDRLRSVTHWLRRSPQTRPLPLGYFGASTGAGAALVAAARQPGTIAAVVSRGGRPDLAGPALPYVLPPTLLLVGGLDLGVIELNQQALDQLRCPKQLIIIPGATHLFPESDTLEKVADLAERWFIQHFAPTSEAHDPLRAAS